MKALRGSGTQAVGLAVGEVVVVVSVVVTVVLEPPELSGNDKDDEAASELELLLDSELETSEREVLEPSDDDKDDETASELELLLDREPETSERIVAELNSELEALDGEVSQALTRHEPDLLTPKPSVWTAPCPVGRLLFISHTFACLSTTKLRQVGSASHCPAQKS